MCSLRDSVQEYVQALEDTDKKIKECPPEVSITIFIVDSTQWINLLKQNKMIEWININNEKHELSKFAWTYWK